MYVYDAYSPATLISLYVNNKEENLIHLGDFAHIFIQSDLQPFIHTPTAASTTQGDSQAVRNSQGVSLRETTTLSQEERGIELATFRLPVNRLYCLSNSIPQYNNALLSNVVLSTCCDGEREAERDTG